MFNDKIISVLIPCLNEESGLGKVLEEIPDFIDEVIVIDNGSEDNTTQIAKKYNTKLLNEDIRGYGSAILRGLKDAIGEIIVIVDGDGSYPVAMVSEICEYMEKGNFDFVSGRRFPLYTPKVMAFINKISNYFISSLTRILFRINIVDSLSGMVLFKKAILKDIKIENKGMGFSQELKIKAWRHPRIKCSEIRIHYYPRLGKVKFDKMRDSAKILYDLAILWIRAFLKNSE